MADCVFLCSLPLHALQPGIPTEPTRRVPLQGVACDACAPVSALMFRPRRRFLQFQLTANVVAVSIACLGALTTHVSPLTSVQMLWVRPHMVAKRWLLSVFSMCESPIL